MNQVYQVEIWGRPKHEKVDKLIDEINTTVQEASGNQNMRVKYHGKISTATITVPEKLTKEQRAEINMKIRNGIQEKITDITLKWRNIT